MLRELDAHNTSIIRKSVQKKRGLQRGREWNYDSSERTL